MPSVLQCPSRKMKFEHGNVVVILISNDKPLARRIKREMPRRLAARVRKIDCTERTGRNTFPSNLEDG